MSNDSKYSLTGYAWTSKSNLSFLGLTLHYIDSDWKVQKVIVGFEHIVGDHSGDRMADLVIRVSNSFSISEKFLMITTDNASNNDTMIASFGAREGKSSVFKGSWGHIRCLPHVINLVCQEILKSIKKIKRKQIDRVLEDNSTDFDGKNVILSVDKLSILIRNIRRNPQKFQNYSAICTAKNMKR
jgi:hypothetical protein